MIRPPLQGARAAKQQANTPSAGRATIHSPCRRGLAVLPLGRHHIGPFMRGRQVRRGPDRRRRPQPEQDAARRGLSCVNCRYRQKKPRMRSRCPPWQDGTWGVDRCDRAAESRWFCMQGSSEPSLANRLYLRRVFCLAIARPSWVPRCRSRMDRCGWNANQGVKAGYWFKAQTANASISGRRKLPRVEEGFIARRERRRRAGRGRIPRMRCGSLASPQQRATT